jgi:hypothetical protein
LRIEVVGQRKDEVQDVGQLIYAWHAASKPSKVGVYDRFADARLVERDGNDGDSFLVKAGGRGRACAD